MKSDSQYTSAQLEAEGLSADRLPAHIAIIMDGNGRWAQARGLPRFEGHRRGVQSVREIVEECSRLGIQQLTLYCFSSENWKRPKLELDLLMGLLQRFVVAERKLILQNGIQFTTIGRTDRLDSRILEAVNETIRQSQNNTGMRLCLALDYGARDEIVAAVRAISEAAKVGQIDPNEITESTISDYLYTAGMVDPDLVIRTSGEMRVSNFLLWQISYAELFVTETAWPDFRQKELLIALRDFASRKRRFGGLKAT
ncbi:isoprenyl transferase [Planctomicrobium sp. SH668]|uniref:isoprenyl transferase n=1 Tax=Planctomicrobium sp. SH668 TaxID=3448126 RepID=UPI003F5BDF03